MSANQRTGSDTIYSHFAPQTYQVKIAGKAAAEKAAAEKATAKKAGGGAKVAIFENSRLLLCVCVISNS